ncbi:MAG: hypothetical protein DLM53_03265 [Candidatus Eremiobacter antarcticus]|nr:undecaprenyl/decaprenyl-phosphate alpha-N-acetylglucosaminyl 1-phosphate transferase [Candidatus Eremiobacteraeota bacterium]MBC5809227.1 undecaprenyl/decaprenyl-phosphate alpha-N-acetylglucosaminyl 1-phosphate transferase [Candidatus Eremiobacteraeota bacterium]PZR63792.1 MAG: hypothetical protein DLM53_03265 [Candidatus Eremiobacter sp. RRmetagenome_bin22]
MTPPSPAHDAVALALIVLVAVAASGVSILIARRFGLTDMPNPLKIHSGSVPRFGGLGILCAVVAGMALFRIDDPSLLWGSVAAFIVGAVDDRFDLRPKIKLGGQVLASCILAYSIMGHAGHRGLLYGLVALALSVGLLNAMNLLDGMNGLAAGNGFLIFLGLSVVTALNGLDPRPAQIFAAAAFGFLPWNFPKARTFMGDSGSLLLGFVLAYALSMLMLENPILLLTGCVIAIVPIFDMLLGIVRRLLAKRPIFQGDRGHFYDRLDATIQNAASTVLLTYLVTAIAATCAIFASLLSPAVDVLCLALLVALAAISSYKLGWLRYET